VVLSIGPCTIKGKPGCVCACLLHCGPCCR
jgi:hypothetical protein